MNIPSSIKDMTDKELLLSIAVLQDKVAIYEMAHSKEIPAVTKILMDETEQFYKFLKDEQALRQQNSNQKGLYFIGYCRVDEIFIDFYVANPTIQNIVALIQKKWKHAHHNFNRHYIDELKERKITDLSVIFEFIQDAWQWEIQLKIINYTNTPQYEK